VTKRLSLIIIVIQKNLGVRRDTLQGTDPAVEALVDDFEAVSVNVLDRQLNGAEMEDKKKHHKKRKKRKSKSKNFKHTQHPREPLPKRSPCVPPCESGYFCEFPLGDCGVSEVEGQEPTLGQCTEFPEVCEDIYAPVCGCDGVTYAKACYAQVEGVSIWTQGECPVML
jgi:hypothetical protein